MSEIAAIVLCAGRSMRMGSENKLFLPFGDKNIAETVIDKLTMSKAHQIIVVVSDLSKKRLRPYQSERVRVVENENYREGMTTSIQEGIKHAKNASGYMICMGDQPFINVDTYDLLIRNFERQYPKLEQSIVVPYYEGIKGNPVIFSSAYQSAILTHTAPEGCKELLEQHKKHVFRVNVGDGSILKDIDTPEDYNALKH